MADISDVLDLLEQFVVAAIFPNEPGTPSVSNTVVNIAQGWPPGGAVNDAVQHGRSLISISAVPSSTSKLPVPLSTGGESVIVAPIHGLAGQATATGISLTGQPNPGEYATIIVNGSKTYSYAAEAGDLAVGVVAALAQQVAVDFPGSAWGQDGSLTIPGMYSVTLRIGAPGTMGQVIDRQRQNVQIIVWAPNPSDRAVLGRAVDLAIKRNLSVNYPDTTAGILIAQTTNLIDKFQDELSYRRDLIVQCQWDTLDDYDAYEVTSFGVVITPNAGQGRTALN